MRQLLKTCINAACAVVVFPATLSYRLQAMFGERDAAFAGWIQLFSLFPGRIGVLLRHAFLRATCSGCGKNAHIGFGTLFSHADIAIGESAYIGNYCSVGDVTIEDDVLIASNVSIMNGCRQHGTDRMDVPIREQPGVYEHITIGTNSWIGERAIIAANIGRHCIIGAGALVTKPIPDYSIAVGAPARVIRDRRETNTDTVLDADQQTTGVKVTASSRSLFA